MERVTQVFLEWATLRFGPDSVMRGTLYPLCFVATEQFRPERVGHTERIELTRTAAERSKKEARNGSMVRDFDDSLVTSIVVRSGFCMSTWRACFAVIDLMELLDPQVQAPVHSTTRCTRAHRARRHPV